MPRTKGGKKDERSNLEKLQGYKDSKIDLFIFFGYYDGLVSAGMCGWVVDDGNQVGSRTHQKGNLCDKVLTPSQFRSKAQKLYLIAEGLAGLGENLDLASYRPHFTNEDFAKFEAARRKKDNAGDPMKKLLTVKDEKALFIFFQYYDGIKTKGKEGFSLNVANFGSVAHMGIYPGYFKQRGENWFRTISKVMGKLAERFCGRWYRSSRNYQT
ncbi:unnamed protein product [Cylindrotheca closterium]|uniref:Uncharacterized protein n=1 Tax=Cylindrotheca closterium TaxID=2856 RepID=A0AAD2JP92_9STRA|nr:unnamed protein product [Cylindrotheca closterium]